MTRVGLGGLTALLVTVALAGCGSSPLSLNDLRTQATAICQTATTQAGRIGTPSTAAATRAFLAAGAAVLKSEVTKLQKLDPPSAQAGQYRTAVGAVSEELQLVRQTLAAVAHTDPATAVGGLQRALTPVRSRGDAAWRALGIPACISR
jgi:hypothetical protein